MHRTDRKSVLKCIKILEQAKICSLRLLRYCTEVVYQKVLNQKNKQRENRDRKNHENLRQQMSLKKRPVFYKQLADVVESVVGAVTIACGVNLTQDFLRDLGVLKYNQAHLAQEMVRLQQDALKKESKLKVHFYDVYKQNEVEKIIGYEFRNKAFLVTALMHKSYID